MSDVTLGTVTATDEGEGVVRLTYSKPPVNTVALEDYFVITRAFEAATVSRDTRVVIFTGEGEKAFCAGADLKARATEVERLRGGDARYQLDSGRAAREAFAAVSHCRVPVIGALSGAAIGAGLAFAASCDILVAQENAYIQAAEINVGLLGGQAHLVRLVGPFAARRLYYTGERIGAAELQQLGAVTRVLPDRGALLAAASELARTIAAKSPIAIRLAKEVFARIDMDELAAAYRMEQTYTANLRTFEDSLEARTASMEGRAPAWKWR